MVPLVDLADIESPSLGYCMLTSSDFGHDLCLYLPGIGSSILSGTMTSSTTGSSWWGGGVCCLCGVFSFV